MPNALWMAGSRLIQAGADVDFQDANLRSPEPKGEKIGVSLLGAPYIPEVKRQFGTFKKQGVRLAVGGQVVNGFVQTNLNGRVDRSQFDRLFGKNTINGNDDTEIAALAKISTKDMPSVSSLSLIPAYERISDADMKKYLEREFSFFLSNGCLHACTFCAAVRTMKNPVTRKVFRVAEEYRHTQIIEKDLNYLVERAKKLGLSEINIYLSNLDVFQTPRKLEEFADLVIKTRRKNPGFEIHMRALSTTDSFMKAHETHPNAIEKIVEAGFHTVGFGVDGGTPKIWQSVRKGHNTANNCLNSIRIAREVYGMTPEVLMVFGHPKEDEESLQAAVTFTLDMVERYQAIPRPHVAKTAVPGSEEWLMSEYQERVQFLLRHPEYFQALDFTALPSSLSHPNPELRRLVEKYYRRICEIEGASTNFVYPSAPEFSNKQRVQRRKLNIGRYDH